MLPYESDGLMAYRQPPMVVVLPDTTEQVSQVLKYCFEQGIKVVPRGSGTSLSGGALPLADAVLLGLGKFKRIREIDFDNRAVVTEPGVTNLAISQAVAHAGFYYAPDPSSQIACSIGGNVAENSGGVHCLKYGMTTNNVLGCEIVLISGEVLRIGGKTAESAGYDLMGIITGSEGLLGVITEITVRILQKPETARALMVGFAEVEAAGECVAQIIGAGIIPGGMEMMDKPAIHAAEAFVHAGYPLDVEALLIIELDGPGVEVDELIKRVETIAQGCGSTVCQISNSEAERNLFWAGRKAAFPAVGRISPDYLCMDGTIPRGALPQGARPDPRSLREIRTACRQRVSCRRRQSASVDPVRRQPARRDRTRRGLRRRYPAGLRRARRRFDRRARRRNREARPDAGDVQRDRSQSAAAAQMRLRRAGPAQSRQGVSDPASLRRTRPHACAWRQARFPRPSTILSVSRVDILKVRDAKDVEQVVRAAIASEQPLEIIGHGTKRHGRPVDGDQCAARYLGAQCGQVLRTE